jgi:hypothetical protein
MTEDCAEVLKRWTVMVDRIEREMMDLLWQREQIRRVGRPIDSPAFQLSAIWDYVLVLDL